MNSHALKWLAKEFVFWYAIPFVFILNFYIQQGTSVRAVFEHLYFITLLFLFVVPIKFFLLEFCKNSKLLQGFFILLYAAYALVLHAYYALVIVGLKTWGKVATIELIDSYLGQIKMFVEVSGYSFWLFSSILALIGCAYLGLITKIFYQRQSVQFSFSRIRNSYLAMVGLFGIFPILIFVLNFELNVSLDSKEPFQQSLLLGKRELSRQLWAGVRKNVAMNAIEEQARAEYRTSPEQTKKNVILIVVDALRSDHLGVYDYPKNTTPFLAHLKEQGVLQVLRNTKASCGESTCGLISIASSRFIHQIPDNPITLQSVLKLNGYKTYMVLGGDHTNFYNLKDLYGDVDYFVDGSNSKLNSKSNSKGYVNDDEVVVQQLENLSLAKDAPIFMQFHLMSAHVLGKKLEKYSVFKPSKSYLGKLSGSTEDAYVNYYDNGVLQSDAIIQRLFENLESRGVLKNSLVVITADHGESLGEHQFYTHAHSTREQLLSIPLLLVNFSASEKNDRSYHSQVDIAPTILKELKLEIPKSWRGTPVQDKEGNYRSDVFYFQQKGEYGMYDFSDHKHTWKYRINAINQEEAVFDLEKDSAESNNLIKSVSSEDLKKWRALVAASLLD